MTVEQEEGWDLVGRFERKWCLEGVGTLPKGEISTTKNLEPGISFENGGFAL